MESIHLMHVLAVILSGNSVLQNLSPLHPVHNLRNHIAILQVASANSRQTALQRAPERGLGSV